MSSDKLVVNPNLHKEGAPGKTNVLAVWVVRATSPEEGGNDAKGRENDALGNGRMIPGDG